jgi:hypothetical protein
MRRMKKKLTANKALPGNIDDVWRTARYLNLNSIRRGSISQCVLQVSAWLRKRLVMMGGIVTLKNSTEYIRPQMHQLNVETSAKCVYGLRCVYLFVTTRKFRPHRGGNLVIDMVV